LTDTAGEVYEEGERRIEMPGVYRKAYDEEFRKNAVDVLIHSGKPMRKLAQELGVSTTSLRTWRDRQLGKPEEDPGRSSRGEGGSSPREMADEIRALRKELERVTRQRDLLKKAMGILSETSPGGMP